MNNQHIHVALVMSVDSQYIVGQCLYALNCTAAVEVRLECVLFLNNAVIVATSTVAELNMLDINRHVWDVFVCQKLAVI